MELDLNLYYHQTSKPGDLGIVSIFDYSTQRLSSLGIHCCCQNTKTAQIQPAAQPRWTLDSPRIMAKRRRPGKNKPSHVEAVDSLIPARLPLEPSSNGPKDGLSAATDALESAAASLTHAASKPESFFQADEGVAKVSCSPSVQQYTPMVYAYIKACSIKAAVHTYGIQLSVMECCKLIFQ